MLENILDGELEEHLGINKYERTDNCDADKKVYRNDYSTPNLRRSFGDIYLDVPRDRNAEFEPQIIRKYETVCTELDKKVISLICYRHEY